MNNYKKEKAVNGTEIKSNIYKKEVDLVKELIEIFAGYLNNNAVEYLIDIVMEKIESCYL